MDFDFHWPTEAPMLLWIVLLPLCGAVINGLFGRGANKSLVSGVAVGTVATSFLLALYCFTRLLTEGGDHASAITFDFYQWFSVSSGGFSVPVNVRFTMDQLSGIMVVMVTGIATLIHLYSTEYMGEDPSYPRFMTYLNLFTASMLILVLASNLPLMFVGWEGVGLCSYLLIGFWWENPTYAAAGRKAFVVNRIGDFGVLIGTFILFSATRSFEFAEINERIAQYGHRALEMGGGPLLGVTIAGAAALFLFLGCAGKSAQLPLYVWLPDAMAGPTPVSALIHAATMVTAGVYLCARLSPVFVISETAMATIAVVGSLTALLGASIGVVQTQMKKILAYSTVSQLGFMFAAVGSGAFAAGMFHVFTHAFFKACLFLGAGSVMHAVHAHGDADIRYLGGLKKYMPKTHATFAIACAAIAGVPFVTAGFYSKDEILLGALESAHHLGWVGYFVFGVLALSAFLTAFYMFRLYFLTFWGTFRGGHAPDEHHHDDHATPHESGDAVTIPLMVLALGSLVVGFLGLPHWLGLPNWWSHWLTGEGEHHGVVARLPHGGDWTAGLVHVLEIPSILEPFVGPIAMATGIAVALAGIGVAVAWYKDKENIDIAREGLVVRVAVALGGAAVIALCVPLAMGLPETNGTVPIVAKAVALVLLLSIGIFALVVGANPKSDARGWAFDKWRVDELYAVLFVRPLHSLARASARIDQTFVDGLIAWVPVQFSRGAGWLLTRAQNGVIYAYTVSFMVGAAVFVWWFSYPHTALVGEAEDATVTWRADVGPGYMYRWDLDADGRWDTDWSSNPVHPHEYGSADSSRKQYGLVVVLEGRMDNAEPIELEISERGTSLPVDALARIQWWKSELSEAADHVPPMIRFDDGKLMLSAHDAAISAADRSAGEDGTYELSPGDVVRAGDVVIRIAARVHARVEVRNAFGNLTRADAAMTLRIPPTPSERIASSRAHARTDR